MKRLFFVFFLSISILPRFSFAQDEALHFFEGTINFKVEMQGPQAQMLQDNEPNDQLQMHVREGSYIINLKGGRYPKTFIFVGDSNRQYSLDMSNQVAYRYSMHNDLAAKAEEVPEAVFSGKTGEVKGITCDIYTVREKDSHFTYYVSDRYRVNPGHYPADTRAKASFLVRGLQGRIPLKTVRRTRGLTVITTMTGIEAREFSDSQFRIPPSFKVENRDYRY